MVLRGICGVATPPRVSIPIVKGVTSSSKTSLLSDRVKVSVNVECEGVSQPVVLAPEIQKPVPEMQEATIQKSFIQKIIDFIKGILAKILP